MVDEDGFQTPKDRLNFKKKKDEEGEVGKKEKKINYTQDYKLHLKSGLS